jgi:hypothetical protein
MRVLGIALVVLAFVGRDVHGQTLTIAVRDSAGQAISQASLTVVDSAGRVVATSRTALGGLAHLNDIAPGASRVMARRFGFLPRYSQVVRVGQADTVAVKIRLDRMYLMLEDVSVAARENSQEPAFVGRPRDDLA